jgi:hypothetical protein
MYAILLILLLGGRCPRGAVPSGGIASSGAVYQYACRTPAQKKELDLWFRWEMCVGESGIAIGNNHYWYSNNPKWVADKDGGHCETHDTYEEKVGDKWVPITHCEYVCGRE